MHNDAVSQAEAVSESCKKKETCFDLGVWGERILCSSFFFFFPERLFYSGFQIQFKCILIVSLFFFFSQILM